jgi:O-acetyl-ADP-ribose deacetylase
MPARWWFKNRNKAGLYCRHSIAFPSLSTGSYGYPVDQAAPIALRTVIDYMLRHPEIRHVRFLLRKDSFGAYQQALLDLQMAGRSAMG